jgi:SAM-dependent methyltransferase
MSISAIQCATSCASLSGTERLLLLTPGKHGREILPQLLAKFSSHPIVALDSSAERLRSLKNGSNAKFVLGRATRLPFVRHSFDAIISFESLYSIRPPWTTIAEFHRVLVPDGKLILIEPAGHGILSSLRDKVSGPGKRIFSVEEVKFRLSRADWDVKNVTESSDAAPMPREIYCVLAIKKENPAEPVPQYLTAKEMMERRKKKVPDGEELP